MKTKINKHHLKLNNKYITLKVPYSLIALTLALVPISILAGYSPEPFETATVSVPVREVVETTKGKLTPEQVEEQIRAIAKEHSFQWTDYLVRLAACESTLNPNAENCKGNSPEGSCDRGVFQINDYHHSEVLDEVAYDLRLATEWTMWRINSGYQHEWTCDNKI